MNSTRIAALGALVMAGLGSALPAQARTDYEAIVRIMRECARIGDIPTRVACYDNAVEAERLISSVPQETRTAAPETPAPAPRASGFGAESLPRPAPAPQAAADEIEMRVTGARRVEPGIYLLSMEDGSQWRFVESAPPSYDPPRPGSVVEVRRAALGSFQVRHTGQRPIRVRRVQ